MTQIDRIGRLKGPLRVTCGACQRTRTWTPAEAIRTFGGDCTTVEARRRLRCAACGEGRTWRLYFSATS